ncbi:hypothetical protein [Knoellia sp. Soil729]|uniref:hypothetical protein n=1 Tax=Knoellia sp. Soil729 TaxID=1736394 RepID=UPI0006FC8929|nr:hypothetical protein [Knoellia sp. Soil729]KRE40261.1 hypothetical protein ASG74_16620 [Knoellia sp. Soil729]
MKLKKVRRLLAEALEAHRVVRVWRDPYDSAFTDGFIIGLTHDWVVMHEIDDGVYLDGLLMMRVRDISTVIDGHNGYVDRALRGLGQSVAEFACPDKATVRDLVVAAAGLHQLSVFALGDEDEEQLMVGRLIKVGKKRVRHHFLRPDGTWAADVDRWRYEQVSSIHIGGRYLDALAQFGDPYPGDGPGASPEVGR